MCDLLVIVYRICPRLQQEYGLQTESTITAVIGTLAYCEQCSYCDCNHYTIIDRPR